MCVVAYMPCVHRSIFRDASVFFREDSGFMRMGIDAYVIWRGNTGLDTSHLSPPQPLPQDIPEGQIQRLHCPTRVSGFSRNLTGQRCMQEVF